MDVGPIGTGELLLCFPKVSMQSWKAEALGVTARLGHTQFTNQRFIINSAIRGPSMQHPHFP